MTYLCAIALTLLVCVGAVQAQDLMALWKTNRRFGPDTHGPLSDHEV
jgi:hypothetical protein